jgi:hypothetical protein
MSEQEEAAVEVSGSGYDYGPIQTYEIVWMSGHVETVLAHNVSWPKAGLFLGLGGDPAGPPRVQFHAQIDGQWRLTLSAREEDIRTMRLTTGGEQLPGGAS